MKVSEARQIVAEVLDNPYPFKVRLRDNGRSRRWFVTWDNDRGFMGVAPAHDEGAFDVTFSVGGRMDLTGGGDSFRTMATVIAALRQIMQTPEADAIQTVTLQADADEKGRVRLYKRLVSKLAKEFGMRFRAQERGGQVNFRLGRLAGVTSRR